MTKGALNEIKLEAIRAFVERVEKRYENSGPWDLRTALRDELAAMEKEAGADEHVTK